MNSNANPLFHISRSRDSIASHLRAHKTYEKRNKIEENNRDPGEEVESVSAFKILKPDRKQKIGHQHIKTEPKTCAECGWVSKSPLLHDRHLLATHGIQVPQVKV